MDKDISYSGLLVKSLKVLYVVLGYLPMAWLVSFLAVISVAAFKLGNVPLYMQSPDPAKLGLESYSYMTLMIGVMALLAVIVWPVLTLIVFFLPYRDAVITRRPFYLFVAGAAGYWIFRLWFTNIFLWIAN
ncbi:MAG TPA: hypothetical protein VG737_14635 [Cyclobacteriaceae bacterium]|nr:hypothetical protein [Cyclobacteriaceae bacterium]